jgi:hypothetical protein
MRVPNYREGSGSDAAQRGACTGPAQNRRCETDYSFQLEATGVPAQSDRLAVRLTLGSAVGRTIVKPFEP